MVTFNTCCDVLCLKLKLPCDKTTGYCARLLFWGKKCKFHQIHEFCILQGIVATFFRCGGQVQTHLRRIYSGFCYHILFESVYFWRSYLEKKNVATFRDTLYILVLLFLVSVSSGTALNYRSRAVFAKFPLGGRSYDYLQLTERL